MITESAIKTAMHDEETAEVEKWAEENLLPEAFLYLDNLIRHGLQMGIDPRAVAWTVFQIGYETAKKEIHGKD